MTNLTFGQILWWTVFWFCIGAVAAILFGWGCLSSPDKADTTEE